MSSHETQLGIIHGSAAGTDSQTGINAPMGINNDNVKNMSVISVVSPAMARGFSPIGAEQVTALDEALTDDSLGLTPPKAVAARGRARSLLRGPSGGRPPLTKRSLSLSYKGRPATRTASPAEVKRLRNASAPVQAADDSVQTRLAALEQQVRQDHAYKLELVHAVQSLQSLASAGQQRFDAGDAEFEHNRAVHLELRRELFAVRDQLTEKVNFVAEQTEVTLKTGFVDIIEAKFKELEVAMATMASHLEQQHVEKPQEQHLVNNAFKYVDDKISQVTEIVQKFE